ncbi:MAG: AAA family ATPase, partial [Sphingopyxis sp.]|nr:AAA family ATPase [Sphingopyxis sp.]
MLTALSIANIVLIERLDLDFAAGLGVLTGETGAGKSILLDALGLALGGRGDSGLVRHGAGQAVVTASFEAPSPDLAALLDENGVDVEPGQRVLKGQELLSISVEGENDPIPVLSPEDGIVLEVASLPGRVTSPGDPMLFMQPDG